MNHNTENSLNGQFDDIIQGEEVKRFGNTLRMIYKIVLGQDIPDEITDAALLSTFIETPTKGMSSEAYMRFNVNSLLIELKNKLPSDSADKIYKDLCNKGIQVERLRSTLRYLFPSNLSSNNSSIPQARIIK